MFAVLPTPHRTVLPPQSLQTISPTQYAYTFSASPSFTHLVIFLLPDQVIPSDTLAGIYLHLPHMQPGEFRLLGALGPVIDNNGNVLPGANGVKVSAVFKVSGLDPSSSSTGDTIDMDMDADSGATLDANATGEVTVGISLEPISTLGPQILALNAAKASTTAANTKANTMLVGNTASKIPSTKLLAQKIIQNAFNFLASFSSGGGQDVVPLKAFEEWWKKFERRVEVDPGFLERDV